MMTRTKYDRLRIDARLLRRRRARGMGIRSNLYRLEFLPVVYCRSPGCGERIERSVYVCRETGRTDMGDTPRSLGLLRVCHICARDRFVNRLKADEMRRKLH